MKWIYDFMSKSKRCNIPTALHVTLVTLALDGMIDILFHSLQPLMPSAKHNVVHMYIVSACGPVGQKTRRCHSSCVYESISCSSLEVNQPNFSLKVRFEEFRQVGGRAGLISSNVVGNQYLWMNEVSRDHHGDGRACLGFTKRGAFFPKVLL